MSTKETIEHYRNYSILYRKHYGKYIQAYRPRTDKILESYMNELISPQKNETILDCGCGFGTLAEKISTQAQKVFAMNIAKDQMPEIESEVEYLNADFDNLENHFPWDFFDKIIFTEAMGYSSNIQKLIKMISNCLKPGGKIVSKEFYKKKLKNEKLIKMQKKSLNSTKEIYNYQILDLHEFKENLKNSSLKLNSVRKPNFKCDWTNAFNFEQEIINKKDLEVMKKHEQKNSLFDCLEIIAEKT